MASELEVLIELLPWLVANNGASTKEVAAKFEISEAKVLDLMQLLVLTGPDQGGGGLVDIDFEDRESLFVFDPQDFDKPIQLTNFEANSLLGGLHYLQQLESESRSSAIGELIEKISSKLPGTQTPLAVVPQTPMDESTSMIEEAITARKVLNIEYASISSDAVSSRLVEPLHLTAKEDRIYLRAWCRETDDIRTFRLDRIVSMELTADGFELRANLTPDAPTPAITATIHANSRFSRELDPNIVKSRTDLGSEMHEIVVSVHSLDWLAGEVLAAGGDCKAIAPEELVAAIVSKATAWTN